MGVGADTSANIPGISGQPGDKGGVYAVNRNGQIMWFHQSLDIIGGASDTGDGRPDGVFGSPVVFDLDRDGAPEVIYNGWDQHVWILNGATGAVKRSIHLLDTIWSTPRIADINGDWGYLRFWSVPTSRPTQTRVPRREVFSTSSPRTAIRTWLAGTRPLVTRTI